MEPNVNLYREIHQGSHMAIQGYDEVIKDTRDTSLRQTLMQMQNLHKEYAMEANRRLQGAGAIPEEPHALSRVQIWATENIRTLLDRSEDALLEFLVDGSRMGLGALEKAIDRNIDASDDAMEIAYRYRDQQRRQLERLRELRRHYH